LAGKRMQARIGGCGPLKILESYFEFPGKERETKTRKKERGGKIKTTFGKLYSNSN
jgi:hypothetical protein